MPLNSRIFEIPRRVLDKENGFSMDIGEIYIKMYMISSIEYNKFCLLMNKAFMIFMFIALVLDIRFNYVNALSKMLIFIVNIYYFLGHTLIKVVYIEEIDDQNDQVSLVR